jgi:hypothetical protein
MLYLLGVALKMAQSSKMLVNVYLTMWHHIPEGGTSALVTSKSSQNLIII